jgi:hypothetical protein
MPTFPAEAPLRDEDLLFRFCVIGDTHVKPEHGDDSSPWTVNELSAGRSRFVAERLRQLAPAFVINLGDLVHPVPDLPTYGPAAELVKSIYAGLKAPLRVIPGNHDIGDKPGKALPAKQVAERWLEQWRGYFGADYQAFLHDEVLFVLLNNPLLNSGLPSEQVQREWLERTLREHATRRKYIFVHYALFLLRPDEPPNYDNVDEPARSWLLGLIEEHAVEAVFAGHVHNYFYNRHAGSDFYIAPSTAFVRQDFSEMFRAAPLPEHENGRNDADKLGFFEVLVCRDGHSVRFVPTDGGVLAEGESLPPGERRLAAFTCREDIPSSVGVALRHPWAEVVDLPLNGPMDEFARKRARNDYPFLAASRMGLRCLRVPLADVLDPHTRARMADLAAYGHRFVVTCFEPPADSALRKLTAARNMLDSLEVVLPWRKAGSYAKALAGLRHRVGVPVLLSKVATSADGDAKKSEFLLYVSSGFMLSELAEVESFHAADGKGLVDGYSIRVESEAHADLAGEVGQAAAHAKRLGVRLSLFLRLAAKTPAPARDRRDDELIAAQVAEFAFTLGAHPGIEGWIDTLADIDRGYFIRHGLIDRRCNLRKAGRVLMNLHAALAEHRPEGGGFSLVQEGPVRTLWTGVGAGTVGLVLGATTGAAIRLPPLHVRGEAFIADLESGRWSASAAPSAAGPITFVAINPEEDQS